jgi:hypothetical protein
LGWSRRIGVALGVLVLGAGAVLAGQALDAPDQPTGTSRAGPSTGPMSGPNAFSDLGPPPAPALVAPAEAATTASQIDLSGSLPADLVDGGADLLRIYVNDELVRTRRVPRATPFTLRGIPLVPGENRITAALRGPGGESPRSVPILIVRDSDEPIIVISAPRPETVLTAEQVAIRGRTEPLARVSVSNVTLPGESSVEADAAGQFEVTVLLALGSNQIVVASQDPAGNRGSARLDLVRSESAAAVVLTVSADTLLWNRLPTELDIVATVYDELGQPVEEAEVFFSISVPGLAATTYRATTINGTAAWPGVRVPRDGTTRGRGRVTAHVTLANGQQIAETASFSVR